MIDKRYIVLLILPLATSWQVAKAEDALPQVDVWPQIVAPTIVTEDDYLGDVPKVLTVSRLSQSLADAPSAVTVIDRETIRAAGIVDLPEVFRLVPGFYVGTNAGYVHNTNHAVSYHGMTTAYSGSMQVLINGRSVYSPLYGGVQWSELPIAIADIERMEITRGPNAASYGANSFFGVINIITQNPSTVVPNTLLATHGNGRNEAFYRHAGKIEDLNYRITTGYREDEGLDNRNDFKRTRLLNAQADYHVNAKNTLEFEFGLADGARGEGNINEDPILFLPRTKQINNHYELARWRHNLSDDSDFSLQAYHSFDRSDDETTSINLISLFPGIVADPTYITVKNLVETERYDLEAQHNFALGKTLRVVWGGSVRQDAMYAPHYLGTNKTDYFNLQRLFGHAEWRAHERLLFNVGAMVEHNDFTGTDISPRASINFKLQPNHTIRLGISSALRTPNYTEEKFNRRVVAPTLDPNISLLAQFNADKGNVHPEHIVSREIGYLGKVGRLSVDARLFHDSITDVIRNRERDDFVTPPGLVLVNAGDVQNGVNDGSATVNGFETQLKWQMARKTDVLLNYAYVKIRETQDGLVRNYINSMPRNTISALITHRFDSHWDASFAYYQTSKTTLLGDGDPVDLIRKSDVRVARKFNSGRWNGEVSAVVENVFNEHYQEFADYNTLKRRARINVSLDF
ncbi:MAG TPA: TonB-dependent receptor [Methylotenera sp.]|nr:TonB-dependent receptor [Methylotenera sp.]